MTMTYLELAVQLGEPRPKLSTVVRHDGQRSGTARCCLCAVRGAWFVTEGDGLALRHAQTCPVARVVADVEVSLRPGLVMPLLSGPRGATGRLRGCTPRMDVFLAVTRCGVALSSSC